MVPSSIDNLSLNEHIDSSITQVVSPFPASQFPDLSTNLSGLSNISSTVSGIDTSIDLFTDNGIGTSPFPFNFFTDGLDLDTPITSLRFDGEGPPERITTTLGELYPELEIDDLNTVLRDRSFDADYTNLGSGNDRFVGSAMKDSVAGGAGDDTMLGGGGNDILIGEEGHDYILGETGNDLIIGSVGRDTLVGGTGKDTVFGGFEETDVIKLRSRNELGRILVETDYIVDFVAEGVNRDLFDLRDLFVRGGSFDRNITVSQYRQDTLVSVNFGGESYRVAQLSFIEASSLSEQNFIL